MTRVILICISTVAAVLLVFAGRNLLTGPTGLIPLLSGPQLPGMVLVPVSEQVPEVFEPKLASDPANRPYREVAVNYYERQRAAGDLERHLLALIEHHPDSPVIGQSGVIARLIDPTFGERILQALEDARAAGADDAGVWANLATYADAVARPGLARSPAGEPELAAVDRAAGYYVEALRRAPRLDRPLIARKYVNFLLHVGRPSQALAVGEQEVAAAAGAPAEAGLLVDLGVAAQTLGNSDDAKRLWKQAQQADRCAGGSPGCLAMEATERLGLLALDSGDTAEAILQLQSILPGKGRCPHDTTFGPPRELAERLIQAGASEAVVAYCDAAMASFVPGDRKFAKLRSAAEAASTPAGAAPAGAGGAAEDE